MYHPNLMTFCSRTIQIKSISYFFIFFGKRGHPLGSYRRSTTQVDPTGPGEGEIPHPEAQGLQILQTLSPGFEPRWKGWEGVGVPSGQLSSTHQVFLSLYELHVFPLVLH